MLSTKFEAIAAAGFDGVEVFDNDLVSSPLRPAEVAARCSELGLAIELYQPIRDVEGVDPSEFQDVLRRVARKLNVASDLGATRIMICSNVQPDALGDPDLSAAQLHEIGALAEERGMLVAFEALAWGHHVNRLAHAWDIVARADHPAVGLTVDTFHVLARGDGAEALAGIPGHRIFFLQIADAPMLEMGFLGWSRHYRCFPGQGMLDVAGVVEAVLRAGYDGPLSLEVFSDVVRRADPFATAMDGIRSMYGLEEELRRRRIDANPLPAATGAFRAGDLFVAPAPPTKVDLGFVELAVRETDGFAPTLASFGFSKVGVHRTKPVEWWRNGGAYLVLNYGEEADAAISRVGSGPVATAIGLLVDDVTAVASRAQKLLWPESQATRGVGEALMPGIRTPGGLQVLLSERTGSGATWHGDFGRGVKEASSGWLGVDHVGLELGIEMLEEETSFYRAVLGMHAGPLVEFTEPAGRLFSRVVSPHTGDARIVLNVEDRLMPQQAWPRGLPNQLAFAVRDLLAAVTRARRSGISFLPIPANYYDDLESRFELDPHFVKALHRNDILFDRTDAGDFLHAYASHLTHAFYIELVQRVGGYAGFGAPNTHVRLACQLAEL